MASNEVNAAQGERQAFAASVFGQFQHHLHRFLMRRLRSAQDAKDLAQEVYLRLLRVDNTAEITQPLAYAYRTAANVVTEFQMRRQREPVQFDTETMQYRGEHPQEIAPDELPDRLAAERAFVRALKTLPAVYRAVFLLKLSDGLSYPEIAARLELSAHTVKKYFSRAVSMIRAVEWE